MRHIDYGLGVFRRAAPSTACRPDRPFDLADGLPGLLARGELAGYEVDGALLRDRLAPRASRSSRREYLLARTA